MSDLWWKPFPSPAPEKHGRGGDGTGQASCSTPCPPFFRIQETLGLSHRWSKRTAANGLRSAPPSATLVHGADLQDDRKDDRMGLFPGLTPDRQSGSAAAGHSLPPEPIKVPAMWLHAADQNLPQGEIRPLIP